MSSIRQTLLKPSFALSELVVLRNTSNFGDCLCAPLLLALAGQACTCPYHLAAHFLKLYSLSDFFCHHQFVICSYVDSWDQGKRLYTETRYDAMKRIPIQSITMMNNLVLSILEATCNLSAGFAQISTLIEAFWWRGQNNNNVTSKSANTRFHHGLISSTIAYRKSFCQNKTSSSFFCLRQHVVDHGIIGWT